MRILNGRLDADGLLPDVARGSGVVSRETAVRHVNPTSVLLMRDPIDKRHNGILLVFNLNPQHLKYEQKALVATQQGRGGYVVSQAGLTAPRWTLQGHFGWRLRTVSIPTYIAQGILGKVITGGTANLIHRIPRLENDIRDAKYSIGSGEFKSAFGQWLVGAQGSLTFSGKQTMDGQQAWFALRDLITYYFETNQLRVKEGKPPYELVWYDSLHALKWVVVPTGTPTLERSVTTQGTMPYTLEFIGVYDDARRGNSGWKLLDAWKDD